MKFKQQILWLFTVCVVLLIAPLHSVANTWEEPVSLQSTYDSTKEWTITFSQDVDSTSIIDKTLYIQNAKNENIGIQTTINDKKVIVTPEANYTPGDYTLYLTDGILAKDGHPLKNTKFQFTILPTIYEESFEVTNTSDSDVTVTIPTGGHFVIYNKHGEVYTSSLDSTQETLRPTDKMFASYLNAPNETITGKNIKVTKTYTPAFAMQEVAQNQSYHFSNTTDYKNIVIVRDENRSVKFSYAAYDAKDYSYLYQYAELVPYASVKKEIDYEAKGNLLVTNEDTGTLEVFVPALATTIQNTAEQAVAHHVLDVAKHVQTTNKGLQQQTKFSVKEHLTNDTKGYYDIATYDTNGRGHASKSSTSTITSSLDISISGETNLTNTGENSITLYGPERHTQFKATDQPALANYSLAPGSHVNVTNAGAPSPTTWFYFDSYKDNDSKGYYNITTYRPTGEGFATTGANSTISTSQDIHTNGETVVTNSGKNELLLFGPAYHTQFTATDEAALEIHTLELGQSVTVKNEGYPSNVSTFSVKAHVHADEEGEYTYTEHKSSGDPYSGTSKTQFIPNSINVYADGYTTITNIGKNTLTLFGAKHFTQFIIE